MRRSSSRARGTSVVEVLTAAALLSITALTCVPAVLEMSSQLTLRAASDDVAAVFQRAHLMAAQHGRDTGVRWVAVAGDIELTVFEDGNGNGVLTDDIRRGIDKPVYGPLAMRKRYTKVSFSFVPGFTGSDPSGAPIGNLTDPIRFGRSSICTFTAQGSSSPGTVYLSNERKRQACVRVSPMTARIQVFDWNGATRRWKRRA